MIHHSSAILCFDICHYLEPKLSQVLNQSLFFTFSIILFPYINMILLVGLQKQDKFIDYVTIIFFPFLFYFWFLHCTQSKRMNFQSYIYSSLRGFSIGRLVKHQNKICMALQSNLMTNATLGVNKNCT